jgi:predicted ABC-type transport system involved in lysophospholipase L1 biosynthesis ATPase subunit
MSEPLIAVQNITKQVTDATGTLTILHEISFELAARESVAIVGASGSGKSTLLSILAGLDTPSSGTVVLAGTDLFKLDEDQRAELRSQQVGFVFQSFQLLGNLTALENVMLPLELKGRGAWAWASACRTTPRCSRAASSNGWRWHAPSCCSPRCCWPTSPPAAWTSRPAPP